MRDCQAVAAAAAEPATGPVAANPAAPKDRHSDNGGGHGKYAYCLKSQGHRMLFNVIAGGTKDLEGFGFKYPALQPKRLSETVDLNIQSSDRPLSVGLQRE